MQSICKEKRRNLFCVSFHFVGKITNKCKHQNVEVKCSNSQIKRKITHCFTAIKCCLIKSNNWINTQRKNLQLFGEWMRARNIYIYEISFQVCFWWKRKHKRKTHSSCWQFFFLTHRNKRSQNPSTQLCTDAIFCAFISLQISIWFWQSLEAILV